MWQYPSELFVWKTQLSSEEGPAARVLGNSEEQKRALNSFTIVPFRQGEISCLNPGAQRARRRERRQVAVPAAAGADAAVAAAECDRDPKRQDLRRASDRGDIRITDGSTIYKTRLSQHKVEV
jgi:hypothetical protein